MPSLDKMMASMGIGNAWLRIDVNGRSHPRGRAVTGKLTIEGGAAAQYVNRLSLSLIDHSGGRANESRQLDERVVATELNVQSGSRRSFSFSLHLPDDAAMRTALSTGSRVDAEADISWAVNPRCSINLDVAPHLEEQAVHLAMEKLGFVKRYAALPTSFAFEPSSGKTHEYFRPPYELAELMDGVIVSLEVSDDKVMGKLHFDPKETTVRELVRSLVSADYRVFGIEFPRSELLTSAGKPNPEGAMARLKEVIEDSRVRFAEEHSHLLRPADAPKENVLLRSASPTKPSKPEELLRPVKVPTSKSKKPDV